MNNQKTFDDSILYGNMNIITREVPVVRMDTTKNLTIILDFFFPVTYKCQYVCVCNPLCVCVCVSMCACMPLCLFVYASVCMVCACLIACSYQCLSYLILSISWHTPHYLNFILTKSNPPRFILGSKAWEKEKVSKRKKSKEKVDTGLMGTLGKKVSKIKKKIKEMVEKPIRKGKKE